MVESKDKTKITFHKGTHTIGGSLVEISYNDSRVFFDLGAVFDPNIKVNNMDDLLDNNLVAFVDELYDPKSFKKSLPQKSSGYKNQAAFVSHAHLDHTSIINFTNPGLDVYASTDTAKILEALSIENDFVFPFAQGQRNTGSNLRNIKTIAYYKSLTVGDLKVSLIPVDHDAYGACGFLIESPNIKIAYTGDIRSHGFRPDLTHGFIDKVKKSDILITEGVSFSFYELNEDDLEECLSENQVVDQILNTLKENADRQIIFNYYPTNFERIGEIYKRIKPLRKLVLTSFSAYLVKKVLGLDINYYKINDKDYGLDPELEISLNDLLKDKGNYFWQMDVKRCDLIENLNENSLYIHSDAEPLGDFDPFYEVFMGKFEKNNIEVKEIGTSGHAPTRDLYEIIKEINPNLLAPIHSFYPERVYYYSDRLLSPCDGDVMIF